jgi:hypothetical protein
MSSQTRWVTKNCPFGSIVGNLTSVRVDDVASDQGFDKYLVFDRHTSITKERMTIDVL